MDVKRYHVKDMQEAMALIRKDLGPDAVILSQRPYRNKGLIGFFQRPLLEVMVAYEPKSVVNMAAVKPKPAPAAPVLPQAAPLDDSRIQALDSRIHTLSTMMAGFADRFKYIKKDITFDYDEKIENMLICLIANGVDEDLAHCLAQEAQGIVKSKGADAREVMEQLIGEIIGEPAPIKLKKFQRTVILFLGPTGVGKTTSLVKLAAQYVVKEKLKVGLINADIYRIAAQEQLRTYAEILQVPVKILYNPSEMVQVLQELDGMDIIFIDTAGKSSKDPEYQDHIMKLIKSSGADEIILALSAPMGTAPCREVINNYSFIENYKLLITKTDETEVSGILLNACYYAKQPLAYLANGQTVPDDIAVQNTKEIVYRLLR